MDNSEITRYENWINSLSQDELAKVKIARASQAPAPSPAASIDTPEFRALVAEWEGADMTADGIVVASANEAAAWAKLVTFVNTWGARLASQSASAKDAADAERYRWLRDLKCNSLHVTRDDGHACNYTTAKDWIENFVPDQFVQDDPAEVQAMKDADTIWDVQIYPSTPIGFNLHHGATLDYAIDAARAAMTKADQ